uniref:Uncharacterized protein n=1 Tax=Mycena chlorophos TaxID=658473 RepID=A0ABQ0M7P6_MYCCL|nr:predicted protein [Mycena chlorophos]
MASVAEALQALDCALITENAATQTRRAAVAAEHEATERRRAAIAAEDQASQNRRVALEDVKKAIETERINAQQEMLRLRLVAQDSSKRLGDAQTTLARVQEQLTASEKKVGDLERELETKSGSGSRSARKEEVNESLDPASTGDPSSGKRRAIATDAGDSISAGPSKRPKVETKRRSPTGSEPSSGLSSPHEPSNRASRRSSSTQTIAKLKTSRSVSLTSFKSPSHASLSANDSLPGLQEMYERELDDADVEYNVNLKASGAVTARRIKKQLAELRERESQWLNFTPSARRTITGVAAASGAMFALGHHHYVESHSMDPTTQLPTCIQAVHLAPKGPHNADWRNIVVGQSILHFGLDIEEHDLLAVLVQVADGESSLVQIQLRTFYASESVPHPDAKRSVLSLPRKRQRDIGPSPIPEAFCDVSGSTLAVSLQYEDDGYAGLYLYDWQIGKRIAAPGRTGSVKTTFLSEGLLVVLNADQTTLNVLEVSLSAENAPLTTPVPKCSFKLPTLSPGHAFVSGSFECNAQPEKIPPLSWSLHHYFVHRPANACIYVGYQTVDAATGLTTKHVFLIQRARFLEKIKENEGNALPWEEWSPQCTRVLSASTFEAFTASSLVGQRIAYVGREPGSESGSQAPLCIIDLHARKLQRQADSQLSLDGDKAEAETVSADAQSTCVSFSSSVSSQLPYVQFRSKELFDFDTVLMDEDNLIGVKWATSSSLGSLQLLHFEAI